MKKKCLAMGLLVGMLAMGRGLWAEDTHIHGYADVHVNNPKTGSTATGQGNPRTLDFHHLVIGVSHPFSEDLRFEAEVDFEHATKDLELEFAYVDWRWTTAINLRVGSLLMPVGRLNEFHEPTLYPSVERPYVETYIIPTTWNEGGAGFYGRLGDEVAYRTYLVSGLKAANFKSDSGIRKGRQVLDEAPVNNLAWVGRVEYQPSFLTGFLFGVSGYYGGALQDSTGIGNPTVTLGEVDVQFGKWGWEFVASGTMIGITDAGALSAASGTTIGERMMGWYAEIGYDLLPLFQPDTTRSLKGFYRYEFFDTNAQVPASYVKDAKNERRVMTAGLAFYPDRRVAFKFDAEYWQDATNNLLTRTNLGMALMY